MELSIITFRDVNHNHDSSYNASTGWYQETEMRIINVSCENLLHNQVKINMFKQAKHQESHSLALWSAAMVNL